MEKSIIIFNHLNEIKYRVIYILFSYLLTTLVLYNYSLEIFYFFIKPLIVNNFTKIEQLIYTDLTEAFFTILKLIFFSSHIFIIPIILYNIYYYSVAGLYKYERIICIKIIIIFLLNTFLLAFILYNYIVPLLWFFFLSFEQNINSELFQISFQGKINEYINLIIKLFLAFNLCLLIPLFIYTATVKKYLSIFFLIKYRIINIIFCFILGALLTPPDIFSQIIIAIPLCCIYEYIIFIGIYTNKKISY